MSSPWPHQFTKDGKEKLIGVRPRSESGLEQPILTQPMICVHCYKRFIQNVDSRPTEPCPARNDKREMKRIKL